MVRNIRPTAVLPISYLVRDEKTALIDTVWLPFAGEFVGNLANEIELDEIDYVIANHAEMDHSGALPELMRHIPGKPDDDDVAKAFGFGCQIGGRNG